MAFVLVLFYLCSTSLSRFISSIGLLLISNKHQNKLLFDTEQLPLV